MLERVTFEVSAGTTICDSRFTPIVLMQWSGRLEDASADFYDDWLRRLLAWMGREGRRGAIIYDLRAAERPPAALRRRIAERRDAIDPVIRQVMVDELMVIDNPIIRGATTAIRWLSPKIRYHPVANLDQALLRARVCLSDHGIEAPALRARDFDWQPDNASGAD
ncbi:MAG: hypothetical protein HC927_09230 [Deltaproteobacteria bacterium]|nr:hypothetical protein [Deltaproteobacteria bacterium]